MQIFIFKQIIYLSKFIYIHVCANSLGINLYIQIYIPNHPNLIGALVSIRDLGEHSLRAQDADKGSKLSIPFDSTVAPTKYDKRFDNG